nr:hypothetical protein [Candidatus Microthrix sp.]
MIARLEDTNASLKQLGERTTSWLSRTQEVPGPQAAETTRVAAKLDSTFHRFAAALAAGEIDHSIVRRWCVPPTTAPKQRWLISRTNCWAV